ncbi:MAG TPA: hypothetical protein VI391_07960, partial [Thermoanaerobaculia bacterium]
LCGCQYKELREPGSSIADKEKRNQIKAPPAVQTISTGLAGPESVLYDPEQDVYFISNINGAELGMDNNGFISRVNAETLVADLTWIQAGKNGVHLDCPKGMAILGDSLYVSDASAVRKFDRRTGAPQGAIELPGASFINDATSDGHSVYISDTGLAGGPGESLRPTGTDAIWRITNDRATKIASGKDLDEPNGLDIYNGQLWAVSFGSNEIYRLDGGKKTDVINVPKRQLDGLIHLNDGTIFVSSWEGQCVYQGGAHGPWKELAGAIAAPADIGYDSKRHRLLIPTGNEVVITNVK